MHSWTRKLRWAVLGMAVVSSFALAHGKGGGSTTTCSSLCVEMGSASVPPSGLFQLQVLVTEPQPLGKGRPAITVSPAVFGTGGDAAVNSPTGQSCGVALETNGGFNVALLSPDAQLGTGGDQAIVTITLPVRSDAPVGTQIPVNLDASSSVFLDGSGNAYSLQVTPGTLTVGGTMNVTSVTPTGVQVPAGSAIAIRGTGFPSSASVDLEVANVVTTKFVSSNEIDITLDRAILLDGVRVRVRTDTQRVEYYPYLRTSEVGSTSNSVIAATYPLFSRITYTSATLAWTRSGTAFTGLALQNPGQNPVQVTLQLLSSSNQVLETTSVSLPGVSKMAEDILDFFPQPPAGATAIHISSQQSIRLLGMQGDTAAGTIKPVIVSTP